MKHILAVSALLLAISVSAGQTISSLPQDKYIGVGEDAELPKALIEKLSSRNANETSYAAFKRISDWVSNTKFGREFAKYIGAFQIATAIGAAAPQRNINFDLPYDAPSLEFRLTPEQMENLSPGLLLTGRVENQTGQLRDGKVVEVYANGSKTPLVDTTKNGGEWKVSNIATAVADRPGALPLEYEVSNNFPNPFNPHTNFRLKMKSYGHVNAKIYSIDGKEVSTATDKDYGAGVHDIGANFNGLAEGIYFVKFTITDQHGKPFQQTRKVVYLHNYGHDAGGNISGNDAITPSGLIAPSSAVQSLQKTAGAKIDSIKVKGAETEETTYKNLAWQNLPDGSFDVGRMRANEVVTILAGPAYNIDSKYDSAGKYMGDARQFLQGLKVFLGSEPGKAVLTDAKGMAKIQTYKAGRDSIFVVDTTATDTTGYYIWAPEFGINIANGTNVIKAFNDTTGIPMMRRQKDENGEDYMAFFQNITAAKKNLLNYPIFMHSVPRIRNEDMPAGVYLNEDKLPAMIPFINITTAKLDSVPRKVYLDTLVASAKSQENQILKFKIIQDSTNSIVEAQHTNGNDGNGVYMNTAVRLNVE